MLDCPHRLEVVERALSGKPRRAKLEHRGSRMEALESGAKTGFANGSVRAPLPLSWDVTWENFPFLEIAHFSSR